MPYVIRKFKESDVIPIATLFYETVHAINLRDYTQEQVDAWAPRLLGIEFNERINRFKTSLGETISYVADNDGAIIGFANITEDGYIDYMYVHKDYQRQGVASTLLQVLQEEVIPLRVKHISVNVSITAKPFFEHHGYTIVQSQTVQVRGVSMINFRMIKKL